MEDACKRITSRIPKRLHEWLKNKAKKANRSMNGELVSLLESAKKKEEVSGKT